MGRIRSKKEKRLQRKLIPLNIVVCVISLVAALTLFFTPILKIDIGKILQNEDSANYVEDLASGFIPGSGEEGSGEEGSDEEEIDYKPVFVEFIKIILDNAKGSVSISAVDALSVLTAGDGKAEKVLDLLLFNDNGLATELVDSLVDGISDVIESDSGKDAIEKALMNTISSQIIKSVEDKKLKDILDKNSDELNGILKKLGDSGAKDDYGAGVAEEYIKKLDELLGPDTNITDKEKQEFVNTVTDLYKDTQSNLKEGESVSLESIISVTISNQFDVAELHLGDLFGGGGNKEGGEKESSAHKKAVDEELEGETPDDDDPDGEDGKDENEGGNNEGDEDNKGEGGITGDGNEGGDPGTQPDPKPGEERPEKSPDEIATSYDELFELMGYNKQANDGLKTDMRSSLRNWLNETLTEGGYDEYLGYYGYIFYGMLAFIVPWLILFLFSLLHIFAGNKRFMTWYVKLLCWIPSVIWLGLKLFPWIGGKFGLLDGDSGAIIKAVLKGITSFTWINGLCYILLWLVMIFWAFPIKRKIRKLRKNDEGDYEEDYE